MYKLVKVYKLVKGGYSDQSWSILAFLFWYIYNYMILHQWKIKCRYNYCYKLRYMCTRVMLLSLPSHMTDTWGIIIFSHVIVTLTNPAW